MHCLICHRKSPKHNYTTCCDCKVSICDDCAILTFVFPFVGETSASKRCTTCRWAYIDAKRKADQISEWCAHETVDCEECSAKGISTVIALYPELYRKYNPIEDFEFNRVYEKDHLYQCSDCKMPICPTRKCHDSQMFVRCGGDSFDLAHGALDKRFHYVVADKTKDSYLYSRLVYLCRKCEPRHDVRRTAKHTVSCRDCNVCNCDSCGVNYMGTCNECGKQSCLSRHFDAKSGLCTHCSRECQCCNKVFSNRLRWSCQVCKMVRYCCYCPDCKPMVQIQTHCKNRSCWSNGCNQNVSARSANELSLCRTCQNQTISLLVPFAKQQYLQSLERHLESVLSVVVLQRIVMDYSNLFHLHQSDLDELWSAFSCSLTYGFRDNSTSGDDSEISVKRKRLATEQVVYGIDSLFTR